MTLLGMLLSADATGERNPLDDRWYGAGTQLSLTGIKVDQGNAQKLSAVWACTGILSSTVACLPVCVMQRRKGGPVVVDDHRASWAVSTWPNDDMGSTGFRTAQVPQQVNAGNCFAEIVQTSSGPQMWPIHYSRVTPARRKQDGRLGWEVKNDTADSTYLLDSDVLHVRSHRTWDGIMGMGVIEHARESIGFGLALEREGASRFANAGRPEVVVEGGKFQNDEARQFYRTTWSERHQGYQNRGKLMMLPPEAKLHVLEFNAVDQQFIESNQFNVETICRWYGVPPHMVQHLLRATFSNIEWMGQDFVTYSLMPWISMWEEEMTRKLLGPADIKAGYYVRFDVDALMRGDSAARSAFYDKMVNQIGALCPNEVRAKEGLPGLGPAGDKYRAPLNMTTLDKLGEAPPKPVDGKLIPRPKPGGQEETEEEGDETPKPAKIPDQGLAAFAGAMLGAFEGLRREMWGLRDATLARRPRRTKAPKPDTLPPGLPMPTAEQKPDGRDERLEAAKSAALESLLDVSRVMVRQEIQAAQSAAKHPAKFLAKVEEFYAKHSERMAASLTKPADVLVALGIVATVGYAITGHVSTAQADLLAASECQPEQLEERVNAALRRWDVRPQQLVDAITQK